MIHILVNVVDRVRLKGTSEKSRTNRRSREIKAGQREGIRRNGEGVKKKEEEEVREREGDTFPCLVLSQNTGEKMVKFGKPEATWSTP